MDSVRRRRLCRDFLRDYREDIWASMRARQFAAAPSGAVLPHRSDFVHHVMEVAEQLRLRKGSVHNAIFLADMCVSTGATPSRLPVFAAAVLHIAAKLEESDVTAPSIASIAHLFQIAQADIPLIHDMESAVLRRIEWRSVVVTAYEVTGFLNASGVVYQQELYQGEPVTPSAAAMVERYLTFFADLALAESELQKELPMEIGIACLLCTRRVLGISPVWSPVLDTVTATGLVSEGPPPGRVVAIAEMLEAQYRAEHADHAALTAAPLAQSLPEQIAALRAQHALEAEAARREAEAARREAGTGEASTGEEGEEGTRDSPPRRLSDVGSYNTDTPGSLAPQSRLSPHSHGPPQDFSLNGKM